MLSKQLQPIQLVYIQYMYFCKRSFNVNTTRQVFITARKDVNVSYHVYIAAAQLEWLVNQDLKIAAGIYAVGWKLYAAHFTFVLHYLNFLMFDKLLSRN